MNTTSSLVLGAAVAGGALLAFLTPLSPRTAGSPDRDGETLANAPGEGPPETTSSLSAASAAGSRAPLAVLDAESSTARLVYGSLAGASGEPVLEGSIAFIDALGEISRATVGTGAYSIVGLGPGSWSVRADCEGFLPLEKRLELAPGRAETRLDLALEPSITLRVKFLDEQGKTIVDATSPRHRSLPLGAIATRERPLEPVHGLSSGFPNWYDAGVYRSRANSDVIVGLSQDCAGTLELRARPPLWISAVLGDRVLESLLHDGSPGEVVFELDRDELERRCRGGLRVRIVDAETGEPLAGSAALGYPDSGAGGQALEPDGTVEFRGQIAGLRELELRSPGHETFRRTVRVRAGETIELGTLALHRERKVRGHLVDENGQPLATSLTWTPAELVASALDIDQRIGSQSGPDGSFEIFAAGRGEVQLFAGRGELAANPIRIAPGGDAEVNAVARRGTLVVIRPVRHAGPGAHFAVADEQGRPFWSRRLWNDLPLRLRLVPGTYQLWSCRDELVERVETFTVAGETLVLER